MKKILIGTIAGIFVATTLNAGEFEKKYEMMDSRINSKIEKYKDHAAAQDFLSKKLACVKAAKNLEDLKNCKTKYHPRELKEILK